MIFGLLWVYASLLKLLMLYYQIVLILGNLFLKLLRFLDDTTVLILLLGRIWVDRGVAIGKVLSLLKLRWLISSSLVFLNTMLVP